MSLSKADPYLATIRVIVKSLRRSDPEVSRELGNAREALYHALDDDDIDKARACLGTLDAGLLLVPNDRPHERAQLAAAVSALRGVLA